MTKAVIMAAALGAFLVGCTKAPDVDPGTCGNRVIEEGEDCDGFASDGQACGEPDTGNECAFICDLQGGEDAPVCPADWQCGRDGRCRQPTGTFDEDALTTLEFVTQVLAIGDIDGNGYNDIVGNQSSRITMRLGGATNVLGDKRDVLVPEPVAPLLFDHLDEDGRMDVIVPIAGGLFTMVGTDRPSLEPVSYASLQLNPLGGIRTLTVEAFTGAGDRDLEIVALTNDGMVFFEADATAAVNYPDGGTFAAMGRDVAVGNVDGDELTEFALAFAGESVVHICQGQVDSSGREGSLQAVCELTPVQLTNEVDATGGTRFADVNGDGALDLLVSVDAAGARKVEVALNDPATPGAFARGEVAEVFTNSQDDQGNPVPRPDTWPIAVADLDGDEASDYVFSKDIMLVSPPSETVLPDRGQVVARATADTWTSAAITDVNGDKRADVVVGLQQLDGIDFFVNNEDPTLGIVFNKFRINTDGTPRLLRGGDFDGDLVGDVAFVQGDLDDDQPNQIAVSFGNTSGAPSAPIAMGSFGKVEVLEPIQTSLGIGDFDTITDLAVVFSTAEPTARLANVLRGDSSRRMLSPFFLFTSDEEFDVPQGMALGSFGSLGVGLPAARDVLVIAERASDTFFAWLLAGTGIDGGLGAFVQQARLPGSSELDYACALWRAGDLDGNPGDEVVGIDTRSGCVGSGGASATVAVTKVDPAAFDGSGSGELAPEITDLGSGFVNLRALHLYDMDLDGSLDIVAAFEGDARNQIGSKAVIFWNDGGAFDFANRRAVIESPPFGFYDLAPVRFGGAAPELFLLSEGEIGGELKRLILRVSPTEPGARTYGDPTVLVDRGGNGHMTVADANGDGLVDIVYSDGDNAYVIPQRPGAPLGSRDSGAANGAAR